MKKYIQFMYIIIIVIFLGISVFIIAHDNMDRVVVQSEKGKIDLSSWEEDSLLRLTGEWQYYEGLMIKDLQNSAYEEYVYVPHTFPHKESMGGNPYGTATYKLNITGLDKETIYGIQVLSEASAYRLTVNGQEVISAGKVGYTADEHVSEMKEKSGHFSPDANGNAELLIEISNFTYNYGGFWKDALFGSESMIQQYSEQCEHEQVFLFSSFLIMGLFFLGLYSLNSSLYSILYFSLICLVSSFRALLTNYKLFYDFIYEISWDAGTRLEFITGYLILPLYVLFFNANYLKPNKHVKIICLSFIASSIVITFFTENSFYADMLRPYIWLCVISLPYFGLVLFQRLKNNVPGTGIILFGFTVLIICMLVDSFMYLNIYILPIGNFFMLICFSVVVIKNLVQIIRQNDYLEKAVIRDPLTGLYNRFHINNLLMKGFKVEEGKRLFVLFFDLDKFKAINDKYGHKVGDEILKNSSKKLIASFYRDSDILCRYGGDEFLAFVKVKDNGENIEAIIARIKKKFEEPIMVGENSFYVRVSIGVSEFFNGDDMEKIIQRSDESMYNDKQNKLKEIKI